MKNNKLVISGAGAWGSALFRVFSQKFSDIHLYSKYEVEQKSNIKINYDLQIVKGSKYLCIVIPAQFIRDFCLEVKDIINEDTVIIICSKGIEQATGMMMYEVVEEILPNNRVLVISGPNFAKEVAIGMPAVSSVACKDIKYAIEFSNKFTHSDFKLCPTNDIISVSLYGALKNVLAIICGVVRALHLGENAVSAVITQGIKEISTIVKYKGGSQLTILEPACIGDLFLTCSSLTSRNTTFGIDLIKKYLNCNYNDIIKSNDITVEGVYTSVSLYKHYNGLDIPLLQLVHYMISNKLKDYNVIIKKINDILFSTKEYLVHNE